MSNTRPTLQHIKAEIIALKTIKPKVVKQSHFGDDHHAAIEAQIAVLENGYSEDDIYDEWGGDNQSHERNSALEALAWMEGDPTGILEEFKPPSEGWKSLATE